MDAAETVNNILTHYGTKGMKWGVRKLESKRPSGVTVKESPRHIVPGRRLRTKGGYGRSASEDAIRVRTSGQVIKKSGVHALSDQELKAYTNRLQLEQNALRLNVQTSSAGRRFVKSLLGQGANRYARDIANSEDVGKVGVAVAAKVKSTRAARRVVKVGASKLAVAAL